MTTMDPMNTIYPTHKCFDDVLEHQLELMRRDRETANRQVIVHGICLAPEGPDAGEPFAHAWVEDDDSVFQAGLLADGRRIWFGVDRDDWYQQMRVQAATKYSLPQALAENYSSGHFGPWVPAYRRLCGRARLRELGGQLGGQTPPADCDPH